jgi:hypothetical protein
MTFMGHRGGGEGIFLVAAGVPVAAFFGASHSGLLVPIFFSVFIVVSLVWGGVGGSGASWLEVDGRKIVAHFTLRPDEHIPLTEIAALEVRRRVFVTIVTIFRRDEPAVIEIRLPSGEAECLLASIDPRSSAPFRLPRRYFLHDLLPLVVATPVVFVSSLPVSWSSFAFATGAFLLPKLLTWKRHAELARSNEVLARTSRA